jgi:hypothetical protein
LPFFRGFAEKGARVSSAGRYGSVPFPVRFLTLALLVGGLIGVVTNFPPILGFWPWEMPPLAHRFLAGAAAAYLVGGAVTLARGRWAESELLLVTVILYGVPLVGAILAQPGSVDWTRLVALLFAGIVTSALVVSVFYVLKGRGRTLAEGGTVLSVPLRVFLLVVGDAATAVGALVYAVPSRAGLVWPWSALPAWSDPLDNRLVASMLLTVGLGALFALWRDDRGAAGLLVLMVWAYCVVVGAALVLHAAAEPAFLLPDAVYVCIFAVIAAAGAGALLWQER